MMRTRKNEEDKEGMKRQSDTEHFYIKMKEIFCEVQEETRL